MVELEHDVFHRTTRLETEYPQDFLNFVDVCDGRKDDLLLVVGIDDVEKTDAPFLQIGKYEGTSWAKYLDATVADVFVISSRSLLVPCVFVSDQAFRVFEDQCRKVESVSKPFENHK